MKKPLITALVVALLPVGAAFAQDAGSRKERMEEFNKRFTEADVNADGKLTLEEAKAKMPMVAEHFDQIDVDKKGYVTKKDIAMAMKKMKAARDAKAGSAG